MAEWSNAAVLKTVDLNGSGGSNPSLSAGARSCKDMHGKSPKGRQAFELQFVSLRPAAGGEGCDARRAANPYSVGKPCVCPPFRFLCHRGFQRFTILMRSDATLRTEISGQVENPVYRCHLAYSVTGVFYVSRY